MNGNFVRITLWRIAAIGVAFSQGATVTWGQFDCNTNGIDDAVDIGGGTSTDCNTNVAPDECDVIRFSIETALANLDANFATIIALVPDRFAFSGGANGSEITGGGANNMYDAGNILNTNLAARIPYTDRTITNSDSQFGPGSRYVTAKYSGLFVMIAENIAISRFEITGDLGTDGAGSVDGAALSTVVLGQPVRVLVKRVFGAANPSVNHIVIVPGVGAGVGHSFSASTDDDGHVITGLDGIGQLYYILVARTAGGYLTDVNVLDIVEAFLRQVILGPQDCNGNRLPDSCDVAGRDVNRNGIPDDCEVDCDENGVPDEREVVTGVGKDCNTNAVLDVCDLAGGASSDDNGDSIPDECQPRCPGGCPPDCNSNGMADSVDIAGPTSEDCAGSGVPDECEMAGLIGDRILAWFPMYVDPGWSTEGDWRFGVPTRRDDDPQSGFTGPNVYGYNLNGAYADNLAVRYLTTTAIDCRLGRNVRLRFRRWLGVEAAPLDRASIQVSSNGREWQTIWENPGESIQEREWSLQEYDISAVADGRSAVRVRWGMGPTDESRTRAGWNLDDILFVSDPAPDCDSSGILDACEIAAGTSVDADSDGTPDDCEQDCNGNGVPDDYDATAGGSVDCDANNVPDECEPDCNSNGRNDACDLSSSLSLDCNQNHVPDECEPDCNSNGAADECDIAAGESVDCDGNAVPDECEEDCNSNGVLDDCDVAARTSRDCNASGLPDECEAAAGSAMDCNGDGRLDECGACPPIEIVFIMDTSGSMGDDASVLCGAIPAIVAELRQFSDVSVTAVALGITEAPGGQFACLTGTVLAQFGNSVPGNPPPSLATLGECAGFGAPFEDWGRATAVMAGRYYWTPGSIRLIVPLSDEGPHCGDPVEDPGLDRDSVEHAIAIAQANDVMVSPITGRGPAGPPVIRLAQDLAAGTGGRWFSTLLGFVAIVEGIRDQVLDACAPYSDCNSNGVFDVCDASGGTSGDADSDGVPDECECAPPRILTQPTNRTVCTGATFVLEVVATPPDVRFQWRRDGISIAGATSERLVIPAATSDDSGTYDVVLTTPCGEVISDAATVIAWPRATGDANGDGVTDGKDIAFFAAVMISQGGPGITLSFCAADMNADGLVTPADVPLFVAELLVRP